MNKNIKNYLGLAFFVLLPLLIGYLSSIFPGVSFKDTYELLNKPSFAPSPMIFGPVWTILYILMGVSAYLIWKERDQKKIVEPMSLFFVQLFFNFLWSPIFFGLGNYLLSFIEIVVLLLLIIWTIISFNKTSKLAAYLMVPYLFWVSFATLLTYDVFVMNVH